MDLRDEQEVVSGAASSSARTGLLNEGVLVRGQSGGGGEGAELTSSMVHLATVEAEMPATPGRSLQCCSQHTERDRSGWADRDDMKKDWWMTSVVSAGKQRQRLAGPC